MSNTSQDVEKQQPFMGWVHLKGQYPGYKPQPIFGLDEWVEFPEGTGHSEIVDEFRVTVGGETVCEGRVTPQVCVSKGVTPRIRIEP